MKPQRRGRSHQVPAATPARLNATVARTGTLDLRDLAAEPLERARGDD